MIKKIKKWINCYYRNNYSFNNNEYIEIIDLLISNMNNLDEFSVKRLNKELNLVINKYKIRDYYYVIEIFEYKIIDILKDSNL
ncbi:MAG: hypothetical protein ACQEQF_10880 [Bacillota bacterium]